MRHNVLTFTIQDGLVSPHEVMSQLFLSPQHPNSLPVLVQMIVREQGRDAFMCWMLRVVGFVLCWISFSLLLQPVCIFLKFIPALFHLCGM